MVHVRRVEELGDRSINVGRGRRRRGRIRVDEALRRACGAVVVEIRAAAAGV